MLDKVNTLIQFAKRANKIAYKQTLPHYYSKRKLGVIIVASDISSNTLNDYKNFTNIKKLTYSSKDELGTLLGKDQVSIFGILDPNISKQIIKLLEGGQNNG